MEPLHGVLDLKNVRFPTLHDLLESMKPIMPSLGTPS
jgi:hypothetical protein